MMDVCESAGAFGNTPAAGPAIGDYCPPGRGKETGTSDG